MSARLIVNYLKLHIWGVNWPRKIPIFTIKSFFALLCLTSQKSFSAMVDESSPNLMQG